MPSELYTETLELNCQTVKALPFDGLNSSSYACYPLARLALNDHSESTEFEASILENEFLKAAVLPALGGRILSLIDKRTGTDLLAMPNDLVLSDEGPHGACLKQGLEIFVGEKPRLQSLSPVQFQHHQPRDDDGAATLLMFELVPPLDVSWHVAISMPPDRAELEIACKVFNRGFRVARASNGLIIWDRGLANFMALEDSDLALWNESRTCGWIVDNFPNAFEGAEVSESAFTATHSCDPLLAPRATASWSVKLLPFSDMKAPLVWGGGAVLAMGEGFVRLRSSRSLPDHKVVLSVAGKTMEASVGLTPGEHLDLSLAGLDALPETIILQSANKAELFRWTSRTSRKHVKTLADANYDEGNRLLHDALSGVVSEGGTSRADRYIQGLIAFESGNKCEPLLLSASRGQSLKHPSFCLLAMQACRESDFTKAIHFLDEALVFDAYDPLAWWLKGVCQRSLGENADESPEILNAHYLAPLEPALRMEGFLSQPDIEISLENPLLAELKAFPDCLVECACLLLSIGVRNDAARWLGQGLLLYPCPLLHYLHAWNYLTSGLDIEAADQLRLASALGIEPPFPVRPLEFRALDDLLTRFPSDDALRQFREFAIEGINRRAPRPRS